MTACRKLGLTIFTGAEKDPSQEEIQRQIVAFAWLQSQPLNKVLTAMRNGTAEAAIDAFEWNVQPGDIKALEAEINRISKLAELAAVDTVSRNTAPDPNEPGN